MNSKKILIIDDDSELAEEMTEILRDNGYCVENTSDSARGELLIAKNTYDVYLLDYKMSGLNGVDLLKKIKKRKFKSDVFIISGRPFIETVLQEEGVHNLVRGVIKKPFNIEVLIQKIKALP
jgi:DNA-binding response OmpR family regulator